MVARPRSGTAGESVRLRWCRRAERSYPTPEARGGGREEQPNVQGAVAAWAQEGREELLHVQGKRNPSKTVGVARRHQRTDTLKP